MPGLFARLTDLIGGAAAEDAPAHPPEALALAALMVQLARADGAFDEDERAEIEALLEARFEDGAGLLAAAEARARDALDSQQFTRLLKDAYAPEERLALIEDLWGVVLADGLRESHEDALMRQLGALLYVPDREVALARQRAEARR